MRREFMVCALREGVGLEAVRWQRGAWLLVAPEACGPTFSHANLICIAFSYFNLATKILVLYLGALDHSPLYLFYLLPGILLCSSGWPGSHYATQTGLKFLILLPEASGCWVYKPVPLHLAHKLQV
jgi:hypothetical protein